MRKLIFVLILFPIIWVLLFFIIPWTRTRANIPHPHTFYIPKYIPTGYHRLPGTQVQYTQSSTLLLITYQNNQQTKLSFTIQEGVGNKLVCTDSDQTFRPQKSTAGCIHDHAFMWTYNDINYTLKTENDQISVQEALKIANSLGMEILFISI